MTRGERWAVGALGAVAAITMSWWALALWPVPTGAPAWLERTRQVCFGSTASGLPERRFTGRFTGRFIDGLLDVLLDVLE